MLEARQDKFINCFYFRNLYIKRKNTLKHVAKMTLQWHRLKNNNNNESLKRLKQLNVFNNYKKLLIIEQRKLDFKHNLLMF